MNVYHGTCVDVISTPLLKRKAMCVLVCCEIWVLLCMVPNVHICMCMQEFLRKFDIGGCSIYYLKYQ